jgi:hypothetical protein
MSMVFDANLYRIKENTRAFRRGMNPTTPLQSTVGGKAGYFTALKPNPYNNVSINSYTAISNAESPSHPPSENPQPRTGRGPARPARMVGQQTLERSQTPSESP